MSPKHQKPSKRVLITGGLGFIGSNIAQALVARGDFVRILDAKLNPYGFNENNVKEIRDRIELVIGDTRDLGTVKRYVEDVDAVIDLAAQVSHTLSIKDPFLDIDINCRGALNVLEAVRTQNLSCPERVRLVYGSTRGVVGRIEKVGDESLPCNPTDMNGVNKLAAEKYYQIYHRVHRLSTVALRINNTYGPRGQMRNDDYGIVNWFIRRALLNEPIVIHGDGSQTRDYNYIDDVVDALLKAVDQRDAAGEVFWLGSGKDGVSLRDMIERILKFSGSSIKIQSIPRPSEREAIEIGNFRVDIQKIQKQLGWTPKTDLDDGLKKTIEFYRKRMSDYVP